MVFGSVLNARNVPAREAIRYKGRGSLSFDAAVDCVSIKMPWVRRRSMRISISAVGSLIVGIDDSAYSDKLIQIQLSLSPVTSTMNTGILSRQVVRQNGDIMRLHYAFFAMGFVGCTGNETKVNQLTPDLAVSVDELDFGEYKAGETLTQNIQLINAGQATLTVDSIEVVSTVEGVFTVQEVPESLGLQEVYDLAIDFTPVDLESYTADLVIQSNDDENPEYTVSLTGIGGLGPLPDIALSTEILDFGAVATGEEAILFLTVRNDGDAELNISQTEQTGSGSFSLLTDLDGQTLPAGSETSVVVAYTPCTGHRGSG